MLRPLFAGLCTYVPVLDLLRRSRASTQGSCSARYCYSVWLRHYRSLSSCGFVVQGASVAELGPGDSIGVGLAALLSGAARYLGLDVYPFAARANSLKLLDDMALLFSRQAPVPDDREFPSVRPLLDSYAFPADLQAAARRNCQPANLEAIRADISRGLCGDHIGYVAPWSADSACCDGMYDLVLSQAVLEHVDDLPQTYGVMYAWLKPGGLASHTVDFSAHWLSPYWNGHWAYSDFAWKLVRGKREFFLNRLPLSAHLDAASRAGFEVVRLACEQAQGGLPTQALMSPFTRLRPQDLSTRGATLLLEKPR